jgi:hypothetical protein
MQLLLPFSYFASHVGSTVIFIVFFGGGGGGGVGQYLKLDIVGGYLCMWKMREIINVMPATNLKFYMPPLMYL